MEGVGDFKPKSILPLVVRRLSRQLPHKSGLVIDEYQQNEVVMVARDFLITVSGFGTFSEVIYGFLTIFEEFIEPLESRPTPILQSILVLLKILSEAAYSDWHSAAQGVRGPVPERYQPLQEVLSPLYSRSYMFNTRPAPLHPEITSLAVRYFMHLKSSTKLINAAAYVTKNAKIPDRDPRSLIDQIDYHVESLMLYISAAGWDDVYAVVKRKLEKLPGSDDGTSYMDILAYLYLDSARAQQLFDDLRPLMLTMKPLHKLLICHFLQDSLQYWYQADGHQTYIRDESLINSARLLFEYVFKDSIDHRAPTVWRFLMMMLVLCPDGFAAVVDGKTSSRKLSSAVTKEVAFLTSTNDLLLRSRQHLDVAVATSSYMAAVKAAAGMAPFDEEGNHPTVRYFRSMYRHLQHILFVASRQYREFPGLNCLQAGFVSSYSFLCLGELQADVLSLMQSPLSDLQFQYNIIRGLIELRRLPKGSELLSEILDENSSVLMNFIAAVADAVYTHEQKPYSLAADEAFGYWLHISALRLSLHLLLSHRDESGDFYNFSDNFSRAIVRCSSSRDESLRETIALVLLDFITHSSAETFRECRLKADTNHVIFAIFEGIGINIRKSAEASLEMTFGSREFEKELTVIGRYWETRMFIIQHFKFREVADGDLSRIENLESRRKLCDVIEEAMVVALCCPSTKICKLALANVRYMVQEALMLEDFERASESSWSIMQNFHVYSELSTPSQFFTALSIQKRMYKLFQGIERPSKAVIRIWRRLYDRWSLLNVNTESFDSSHEKQKEWRSYAGLLASLLASLLNLDGSLKIPDNVHFKARQFLLDLVNLTISNSTFLSETSREVLASDLNPLAYQHVLRQLNSMLDLHIEKKSGLEMRLVSQTALFLRPMIERLKDEDEFYISVDVGGLSLKLVRFLKDIGISAEVLRVKVRVCQLLESIGNVSDSLNVRYELKVRNELVRVLGDWLEKCTAHQTLSVSSNGRAEQEKERALRDLSVAISKALTTLLDGMIIQVPDGTHEKDVLSTKHSIFSNLFALFLRVLHRCKPDTDGSAGYNILADKVPLIRSQTILGLSYMLIANVDVGLRVAISLGYHEDLGLRLAFLEIFKNILSQGTSLSPEFGMKKRYEEMIDFLVLRKEATLMLCEVCPANEVEDFATALLHAFDSRGKSLQLIKDAISKEIEQTDTPAGLFRGNSVATKLLSIFVRSRGIQYLQSTLGPFLNNLVTNTEACVFEIEMDRLKDHEEISENTLKCKKCVEELIESLDRTEKLFPTSFREICVTILHSVEKKFPEAKEIALSGFFLLRFICPALVAPENEGLVDKELTKPVRRTLLLLAKILQHIANSTTMKTLVVPDGPWVEEKNERLLSIIRNLAVLEETPVDDSSSQTSNNGRLLEDQFSIALHRYLYQHWDEAHHRLSMLQRKKRFSSPLNDKFSLEKETLQQNGGPSGGHFRRQQREDDMDHYRDFSNLVRIMGQPAGVQHSTHLPTTFKAVATGGTGRLADFMDRNAARDLSVIIEKRLIHEGIAKDGKPVVVISSRNYDPKEMDTELVLYRFFQVASKMWQDEFYVFWDSTGNFTMNPLPAEGRSLRDALIPPEFVHNLKKVFYYNVTSTFLPILKANICHQSNAVYMNPATTEYIFLTSANVADYFNVQSLNLDLRSQKLVSDVRLVYSNVIKVVPGHAPIPVTLKLGNEFLQIMGEVPFNYVRHWPGFTNDSFHLSEITSVYIPQTSGSPNDFILEVLGRKQIVTLQTKRRHEIVRAIQNAKSRLPEQPPKTDDGLTLTVDESVGCLLNIGFANLCSSESAVQEAAYNLLAVIPARFNIDFERELKGGPGLAIPKNEVAMAVAFSEAAARSQPSLTYNFLCEFMITHRSLPPDQGINAVLYAAPWVKNIYKHVYLKDEEKGSENTSFLIRNFLDITCRSDTDYNSLILNFWPVICFEDALAEILVDEVVGFVLDVSADLDKDVGHILAVVTSFPTLSICGTVLARIRRLLNKTLSDKERSLVDHPNWAELVVLIRLTTYLTFDSLDIVEVYLPEIFLLIISFLYTGPYELRSSLYKLLVNVLHAFSCSDKLSVERKEHVVSVWNELATGKGKVLFGLSEETRGMKYDYFVLAALSQIETCCNVLLDILSTVGTVEQGNMWRSRWCSFVMNSCFIKSHSLQCRSFLVLGCLARIEVDDVVVSQVLQVLKMAVSTDNSSLGEEYCACTVLCLTKMMDGLSENSMYPARLFWLALAILKVDNDTLFNNALLLLQSSLRTLDNLGAFKLKSLATFLLAAREPYFDEWEAVNEKERIGLSEEYFDLALCGIVLKGLEKSTTKPGTINALETLLEISAKNNVRQKGDLKNYPSYLCYVYFLYLCCRSQSDLKDLLWISGYPDDPMDSESGLESLPRLLKEYLDEESLETTICLALGARLFLASTEYDVIATRFLASISYVGRKDIAKKCMVYSMVRGKLFRLMETGSTNEMLKGTLQAAIGVLRAAQEFERLPEHRANVTKMLIEKGFEGVAKRAGALPDGGTIGAHASNKANWLSAGERTVYASLIDGLLYR